MSCSTEMDPGCPRSWKQERAFSSVQSLSRVWLFVTPLTAAHQASRSITNSQSLLKLMSIELVMPSNHPLSSPSLPAFNLPSIRVFSNESPLCIRWPKYGASASVLSMNIQDWFSLGLTVLNSLLSNGLSRVFSNTTVQKHQFFGELRRRKLYPSECRVPKNSKER